MPPVPLGMKPSKAHLMEIEMVDKKTPKEIQEPKRKSDWPDMALFTTADGKVLEPGDEGYDNVTVNQRFALKIKECEAAAKELRELRIRVHEVVSVKTVPLSSRDAVRASMANEQRARMAQDSQKQQLRERLSEMGLLPD
jgi:hypothetical protein